MKILDTKIPEVKIIEPDVFGDHRGWFMETWSLPKYEALALQQHAGQRELHR